MRFAACALTVAMLGCGSRSGLPAPSEEPDSVRPNPLCNEEAGADAVVLAKLDSQPSAVVRAGSHVVVADWAFTGSIYRVPRVGGDAVELTGNQASVNDLATDGSFIYWVTQGYGGTDGALQRMLVKGGGVQLITTGLTRPQGVAALGQYIYVTDGYGPPGPGRVQRVKRGTTQPTLLAGDLSVPWDIAADSTGLYFTDAAEGAVYRLPLLGGKPAQLASDLGLSYQLAVGGGAVFWASRTPGTDGDALFRREHAAGQTVLIEQSSDHIEGIVADERATFYTVSARPGEPANGRVKRVDSQGVEVLSKGAWRPLGIALDDSAVYFATIDADGGGSVRMVCRPVP